jgi:hypothetical protein
MEPDLGAAIVGGRMVELKLLPFGDEGVVKLREPILRVKNARSR